MAPLKPIYPNMPRNIIEFKIHIRHDSIILQIMKCDILKLIAYSTLFIDSIERTWKIAPIAMAGLPTGIYAGISKTLPQYHWDY